MKQEEEFAQMDKATQHQKDVYKLKMRYKKTPVESFLFQLASCLGVEQDYQLQLEAKKDAKAHEVEAKMKAKREKKYEKYNITVLDVTEEQKIAIRSLKAIKCEKPYIKYLSNKYEKEKAKAAKKAKAARVAPKTYCFSKAGMTSIEFKTVANSCFLNIKDHNE